MKMSRSPMAPLALTLVGLPLFASCQGLATSAGPTTPGGRSVTVHLAPALQAGRLVQATIPVYGPADIATLDVVPLRRDADGQYFPLSPVDGATVSLETADKVMLSIAGSRLDTGELVFRNLQPDARYRFQARAIDDSSQAISVDAGSSLDLELGYDDRPVMARIPVQLKNRPFSGSGQILLRQVSPIKNYDTVRVGLYDLNGLAVTGATASFTSCAGKIRLTQLPPFSRYLAMAEALDASGSILSTATASLEVTDDDMVPDLTLAVDGAPPS